MLGCAIWETETVSMNIKKCGGVSPASVEAGPLLHPIERIAVNEQIISRLKVFIAQEHVTVGAKFPSERQLASMLKVSRNSIREALRVLEVLGVLKPKQGKGTFLVSPLPQPLNRPRQIQELQESVDIVELWELRAAVEPSVAALAALRAVEDDFVLIDKELRGMRANIKNLDEFAQHDLQFHLCVARACGNDTLVKAFTPLIKLFFNKVGERRLLDYAEAENVPRKRGQLRAFLENHEQILEALRCRNPTLARSRMVRHMRAVGEYDSRLLRAMAAHPDGKNQESALVALR